jgi:hypothetical protein
MFNDHPQVLVYLESYWHAAMFARFGLLPAAPQHLKYIVFRTTWVKGTPILQKTLDPLQWSLTTLFALYDQTWGPDPVTVAEFNDRLSAFLLQRAGKRYYADKTPHYGFNMQLLQTLWPDLRFIHIIRHGIAVAFSMQRHPGFQLLAQLGVDDWTTVAQTHAQLRFTPRPSPLPTHLSMWARQVRRIRDEATRVRPGTYLEVRYEHLLTDPVNTLEALCHFVGLAADQTWARRQTGILQLKKLKPPRLRETPEPEVLALLEALEYRL